MKKKLELTLVIDIEKIRDSFNVLNQETGKTITDEECEKIFVELQDKFEDILSECSTNIDEEIDSYLSDEDSDSEDSE